MKGLGIRNYFFIVSMILLTGLSLQSCDGSNSSNQGGSWSSKPYNRYQKEQQRKREAAEKQYQTSPTPSYYTPSQSQVESQSIQSSRSRSVTPDDAYDDGYSDGYAQGEEDARHGKEYGYGYNDSSDYYGHYETKYCEGYEDGYNDGYN